MQLLLSRIAVTFADDLAALVTAAGRIVLQLAMAPFEPIAKACDVEGVLAAREARMQRTEAARLRPARRRWRRPGADVCACRATASRFTFSAT